MICKKLNEYQKKIEKHHLNETQTQRKIKNENDKTNINNQEQNN